MDALYHQLHQHQQPTTVPSSCPPLSSLLSPPLPPVRVVRERTYNTCVRSWAGLQPRGFGDNYNNPDMITVKQAMDEELVELIPSWLCGGDQSRIDEFVANTKLSRTQLLHEVNVYSYGSMPPPTTDGSSSSSSTSSSSNNRRQQHQLDNAGLSDTFWTFFRSKHLSGHRIVRNSKDKKERGVDGSVTYVEPDFDDGKFKYRTLVLDGPLLETRKQLDAEEPLVELQQQGGGGESDQVVKTEGGEEEKAVADAKEEKENGRVDRCGVGSERWLKKALSDFFMSEFEVANCCEGEGGMDPKNMQKVRKDNAGDLVKMAKQRMRGFRQLTTIEIYDVLEIQMSEGWENVPLPCGMDGSRHDSAKYLLFKKPMEYTPPKTERQQPQQQQRSVAPAAIVVEQQELTANDVVVVASNNNNSVEQLEEERVAAAEGKDALSDGHDDIARNEHIGRREQISRSEHVVRDVEETVADHVVEIVEDHQHEVDDGGGDDIRTEMTVGSFSSSSSNSKGLVSEQSVDQLSGVSLKPKDDLLVGSSMPAGIPRLDIKNVHRRGSISSRMTAASIGTHRTEAADTSRTFGLITERSSLNVESGGAVCCAFIDGSADGGAAAKLRAANLLPSVGGGVTMPTRGLKRRATESLELMETGCEGGVDGRRVGRMKLV
eukprot:GHVS01082284.1.p1 GENE.GHVS01082284.1~~GHVS01082284.1.p1  ORF type:complete len:660 (-),score=174.11 GHVS01082284.1:538-2517(-)